MLFQSILFWFSKDAYILIINTSRVMCSSNTAQQGSLFTWHCTCIPSSLLTFTIHWFLWKRVKCYVYVISIVFLSCCWYLSTARSTVGAGFGRGLGQPSEGLHERKRVPPGLTLWQPAGWWETTTAITLAICFHSLLLLANITYFNHYPLFF